MTTFKALIVAFALFFAGCNQAEPSASQQRTASVPDVRTQNESSTKSVAARAELEPKQEPVEMQDVSLSQADQAVSSSEAFDRKIIRNADLSLEVNDPNGTQQRIASIAESVGGFVITSETKQSDATSNGQSVETSLVVRVPSSQFGVALDKIRALGSRIVQEKVSGQDVTEEFIDLEARIKTQKALEEQFLEIMKRAGKVSDALEVQTQIASVRSDIERLEGRKRFLESRTSLSTINATLRAPRPIVASTSSFGREIKDSVRDSVSLLRGIVLFLVRFVILVTPMFILVVVPGAIITRIFMRRAKRIKESMDSAAA